MHKLLVRLISGIVYIGLILGCYFAGGTAFSCLVILFAIVGYLEFTKITGELSRGNFVKILLDLVCLLSLIGVVGCGWNISNWMFPVIVRMVAQLYYKHDDAVKSLSLSMLKQVYLGVGLGSMLSISMVPNYLLVVLALIWINDTGAYLVGSAIGKHRLFERISPKKSWEGFFGGLVLAVACVILLGDLLPEYFRMEMTMEMTIIFAVLIVVMATFGDLIESQVKRTLHIKDSGTIIPGHGGLLDRIDSILLAMPTAWILINMLRGIY